MQLFPYIMVLCAAVLWGTTGTTQTFLSDDMSAIAVACIRSGIGGGLLFILVLFMRNVSWRSWPWRWNIAAAVAIALFQVLFFSSIRYTGVAIGTVVTIGSSPVFAGLLEWLIWKNRPARVWIIATACAVIGCILLFANSGEAVVDPAGVGLALCAGFFFALYANVSKKLMEQVEALPAVALTFSLCALLLSPVALTDGVTWLAKPENLWPMLYMGVMTTSIAYVLFLSGLRYISSSAAVTLSLGEPLTAALLGVFFLNEYLSMTSWSGVLLILGAIIVLTVGSKSTEHREMKA